MRARARACACVGQQGRQQPRGSLEKKIGETGRPDRRRVLFSLGVLLRAYVLLYRVNCLPLISDLTNFQGFVELRHGGLLVGDASVSIFS